MDIRLKVVLRYILIMLSLFFMANGVVILVRAQIGVSPWNVLHIGISQQTGISLGKVIQGMGLLLVAISYVFHVKPRFVTLLNMYFVGLFVDVVNGMNYIPQPDALWLKFVTYVFGVAICGFATALYMSGNRGAGPRDNLMLALTKATSLRMGVVRTMMEITVATVGFLLGGPLGIGTILFAMLVGVFVEIGFAGIGVLKRSSFFHAMWDGIPAYSHQQ